MKFQLIFSAALALLSTAAGAVSTAYPVSGFDSADLEDEAFFAHRRHGDCRGGHNSCARSPGCEWRGSHRRGSCNPIDDCDSNHANRNASNCNGIRKMNCTWRHGRCIHGSTRSHSCTSNFAKRNARNCNSINGCSWRHGRCIHGSTRSHSCTSNFAKRNASNCNSINGCRWVRHQDRCVHVRYEDDLDSTDMSSENYDFELDYVYDEEN